MSKHITVKHKDLDQVLKYFKPMCNSDMGGKHGRFDFQKNHMYITCYSPAEELSVRLPVEGEACTFALDLPLFINVFQHIPPEVVDVKLTIGENQVTISTKDIRFEVALINLSVLPSVKSYSMPAEKTLTIKRSDFLNVVTKQGTISQHADGGQDSARGLYFRRLYADQPMHIVALNGHELVLGELPAVGPLFNCCIEYKSARVLMALLKDEDTLSVGQQDANLIFQMRGAKYIARAICSQYPDYEAALKAQAPKYEIKMKRVELQATLQRATVINHMVDFTINKDGVVVGCRVEGRSFRERLQADFIKAEPMSIGLNAKKVAALLQNHDSESILIQYAGPRLGVHLIGDKGIHTMVMPCLLPN